ncbi:Lrp/AsnC family transcriptional regulator [Streptomyces geranii]|uniref:Lrp/AsnC family transcriptional regulator n=1 Tax=Streptomyces geranii TaxID=2058923 RepID=UPI000D02AB73|nr:Lrp/AsnC family transcriptional regulator [Streptomyces geranii]
MLDEIDRGLVHALHIDGRAPFARIGAVLGVSAQTVARRYRRLRAEAGLRVVGLASPGHAGQVQWLLRLTSVPHSAQDLARALARRPDTSWVRLASGGTEILAMVRTPSDASDGHALLLHDIPRTAGITSVSAHSVLHVYVGGPTTWGGRTDVLTEEQVGQLRPEKPESAPAGPLPPFGETDRVLLDALAHDGRAGLADLASATGWSPATAARRLAELRSSGALFFDIDLNDSVLGAASQTLLWMSVEPAHLDRVARALAGHGELAFVAATTGPMNLVAQAVCPGPEALHTYLTRRLAPLPGIHTLETTPVLRTLKATGPLTRSPVHPGP